MNSALGPAVLSIKVRYNLKKLLLLSVLLPSVAFAQAPPGFIPPVVDWNDVQALHGVLNTQVPPAYHDQVLDWLQRLEDREQRKKLEADKVKTPEEPK